MFNRHRQSNCIFFAERGWNVVATMRTSTLDTNLGHRDGILITRLDVQDRESIYQAIDDGIARFGKIDALINNAGFSLFGIFEAIPRGKVLEQFDVNVFGVMEVTRAILPHFKKKGGGLIINISSRAGLIGLPMLSLYCAAKFALEGFSESLAYELASQNIIIKIVEPSGGVTSTNFSERMGKEKAQSASITDYDVFVGRMNAMFAGMQAERKTSADDVAEVIYGAATDGSDRLRYFVGEDVGGLVQAKRAMSDQGYIEFVKSLFLPKS